MSDSENSEIAYEIDYFPLICTCTLLMVLECSAILNLTYCLKHIRSEQIKNSAVGRKYFMFDSIVYGIIMHP